MTIGSGAAFDAASARDGLACRDGPSRSPAPPVRAALVSDYVAGRLDDVAARGLFLASLTSPALGAEIAAARAVCRRVARRFGSRA